MPPERLFDVPRQPVATSLGTIELPIVYRDAAEVLTYFPIPLYKAEALLASTPLAPVRFMGGNALVTVSFFDYLETSIGPYRECGVAIAVIPRGRRMPTLRFLHTIHAARHLDIGFHVIDLPVTTKAADVGGRELWGYPKFVTRIDFQRERHDFRGVVFAPGAERPIATLEGSLGVGVSLRPPDLLLYSVLEGQLLRTLVKARGSVQSGLGRGLTLRVGDAPHPMVERLRALGLEDARPAFAQAGAHLQMALPSGEALAFQRAA